jgi:cytochrome c oxidase subunit 2
MSRRARIGAVAALGVLLAGCAEDAPQDMFQPAGPNAESIYDLSMLVFILAGIVGVIVLAVVFFVVVKFRDRGQAIPEQIHGKPTLEIILTIIPAIILIGIAIPTVSTLMALNDTSDTECVINVTGQQWWWEIDYPVQDGCGEGISQPIVTSGEMVIPVGTPVLVRGTSRDVIHSWWIPRLNGKRDMVPGRVHTNKIEADEPGIYAGQCTEF